MTSSPAPAPEHRILVGIDTPNVSHARTLANALTGLVGGIKLGMEFFNANGSNGVRDVTGSGKAPLFLDLKFHDIPNTVAGAVRATVPLQPMILNVHASGGPAMMRAAQEAAKSTADDLGIPKPLLIAVTVLTSLDADDLDAVGQKGPAAEQALRLATLTQECGLDGVVCSPHEITAIRNVCGPEFKLIVPGIRPAGSVTGDQKRVMTPKDAVDTGADWIVIGRPITQAEDPAQAARDIASSMI